MSSLMRSSHMQLTSTIDSCGAQKSKLKLYIAYHKDLTRIQNESMVARSCRTKDKRETKPKQEKNVVGQETPRGRVNAHTIRRGTGGKHENDD